MAKSTRSGESKPAAPRKRPGARPRKPRLDPATAFTAAMAGWFQARGYNVGLDVAPFGGDEATAQFKKLLGMVAKVMPATGMPFLITTGANSDAFAEALAPFIGMSDLVGSKAGEGMQAGLVIVVPVLRADNLAPEEIRRRYGLFLEYGESLDEFGPRLNFQSMGQCRIYPLLVYFDSAKCQAAKEALLAESFELRAWKHVALRAAFLDVTAGTVTRAEMSGIAVIGAAIGSLFGSSTDVFDFTAADLAAVRTGTPT